jgi:hypothetical protein
MTKTKDYEFDGEKVSFSPEEDWEWGSTESRLGGPVLYHDVPLDEDEVDIRDVHHARKWEDWGQAWGEMLSDPVYLWYILVLLERAYSGEGEEEIPLGWFADVPGCASVFHAHDERLELMFDEDDDERGPGSRSPHQIALYRLLKISEAFCLFDVWRVGVRGGVSDTCKKIILKALPEISKESTFEDADYLYSSISGLIEAGKQASFSENFIPFYEEDSRSRDLWLNVAAYGEFAVIEIQVSFENETTLRRLLDWWCDHDDNLDQIRARQLEFFKLMKACERIGDTVFVPLSKLFADEGELFRVIHVYGNNESVAIDSFLPPDGNLSVTVFDPELRRYLGMDAPQADMADAKGLSFNQKGVLCLAGKPMRLGEANLAFVSEFFDLYRDGTPGVSVSELIDVLERGFSELDERERGRAKKRLIYDRRTSLNERIAKECGVREAFQIRGGMVCTSIPVSESEHSEKNRPTFSDTPPNLSEKVR